MTDRDDVRRAIDQEQEKNRKSNNNGGNNDGGCITGFIAAMRICCGIYKVNNTLGTVLFAIVIIMTVLAAIGWIITKFGEGA